MEPAELISAPPPTHFVYIPFILVIGMIVGFVLGRRAGMREGEAHMLGSDEGDDLL